jgi:glycine dehydrogenase subunit 1
MNYIPHTDAERAEMLKAIGVRSLDELFAHLPAQVRCGPLKLPPGLSEMETQAELVRLAARNRSTQELACFLGAGAYDHFIPPAALELASRGEIYTAYTPYQPEISQGILQLIYEYQTMVAELTGLDAANASLYDGATALQEACQMALRHTGRMKAVVLDGTLHPHYLRTVQTGMHALGVEVRIRPPRAGSFLCDLDGLAEAAREDTACVAVGYPNFFGAVEDLAPLSAIVKKAGALLVVVADPFACGVLQPPGAMGANIVCGDAQSVGVPLQFGGPYLGYLACTKEVVRRMPGRLVGQTVDVQGRRAFTLTLQAREQHIRREKATSNICSNEALCAIMAHFYLSCVGRSGLRRAGELCVAKSDLLRRKLKDARGVKAVPAYPAFQEFVYETEKPAAEVLAGLLKRGILGGVNLGQYDAARDHQILACVTEKRTAAEIEAYVKALMA